jgi:hypothetical protein
MRCRGHVSFQRVVTDTRRSRSVCEPACGTSEMAERSSSAYVRSLGTSRLNLLSASFSDADSSKTFSNQICCDGQPLPPSDVIPSGSPKNLGWEAEGSHDATVFP